MEAHTPKREAIQKFIEGEIGTAKGWRVRTVDEAENPIVVLEAQPGEGARGSDKKLEIHTRQVRLEDGHLDEATQIMIRRWMASL